MLRVYQSKSASQAKDYFRNELTQGDYYSQEIVGNWGGNAAEMLGLSGAVTQEAFDALIDNIHPPESDHAGERLTAHNKSNRRPGYDLTFSAPKALSLLYEYSQDERLLQAFRDSVSDAMQSLEEEMHVRVRKGGLNEDRKTGNLVYAEFVHFTARPVEDADPDPQLHAHCYVPNVSFDAEEQQWKAGEFSYIKRDASYYEALFHSHLTKRLSDMGLSIERDERFWTIEGLEKDTLRKFSNRSEEIEAYARENNITSAKAKDQIGAKIRAAKNGGLGRDELREVWWDRLDEDERETLDRLSNFSPDDAPDDTPQKREQQAEQFLDYSIDHNLERQSVVPLTKIKEIALRQGFGKVDVSNVEAAVASRNDLIVHAQKGREFATTKQVLKEEQAIIKFTVDGYGTQQKLNADYHIPIVKDYRKNEEFELSDEQKNAVTDILESRHRVMTVQGKAGVGKTTMMASLIQGIKSGGGNALVLAPTADAANNTLRDDGEVYHCEAMQEAQTLAKFFTNKESWEENRGNTIIVDEAGLMGAGDMHSLFAIANHFDNRVVLVGDTGQHNSVARGDAFRILQEEAGLETLTLENIRRQKGKYKFAVDAISKGDLTGGFDRLDKLEAITEEADDEARYRTLGEKYADYVDRKESTLTVAPTHAEGKRVNDEIRRSLKERGHIKEDDRNVTRYKNLQLTEAELGSRHTYKVGQMIRYQQNAKGNIKRGSQFTVSKVNKGNVWIKDGNGVEKILDRSQAKHFNVYERQQLALAAGDKIRITEGGKSKDGKRLINGSMYQVKNIQKNGDIELGNGMVLDGEQGNITHGYVTTSYASQGKTVKHVMIAQSTDYGGAASAEQFYVSVSRGKKSVEIFTDDKKELREQIQRSHQRLSAIGLLKNQHDTDKANKEHADFIATRTAMVKQGLLQPNFMPVPPPVNDRWQDRVRQNEGRGLARE